MWGWLKAWFVKERLGVYAPKERLIYRYFDGSKEVAADPADLYRKLMDVGPELSADVAVASSPSKAAREATGKAIEKVRGIFGLQPFPEGLGEAEAYELLDHFVGYCTSVKKNLARLPMYLRNTPASSPAGPDTSSSSASGSTVNDPSTAAPVPLPTASGLPSDSTPEMNTGMPSPLDAGKP